MSGMSNHPKTLIITPERTPFPPRDARIARAVKNHAFPGAGKETRAPFVPERRGRNAPDALLFRAKT